MTTHEPLEPLLKLAWDLATEEPTKAAELVERARSVLAEYSSGEEPQGAGWRGRILLAEAKCHLSQGSYLRAQELSFEAQSSIDEADGDWLLQAHAVHGASLLRRGELEAGRAEFQWLVDRLRDGHQSYFLAISLSNLAAALRGLRRAPEALEAGLEAVDLFEACGETSKRAGAMINIGNIYSGVGDFREALVWFDRCHELASEIDDDRLICHAIYSRCEVFQRLGLFEESISSLESVLQRSRRLREPETERAVLHALGEAYREAGNADEAYEAFLNELRHGERRDVAALRGSARLGLGQVALELFEDPQAGLEHFEAAIAEFAAVSSSDVTAAWLGAGQCCVALGRYDEALSRLLRARSVAEGFSHPAWLASVLEELSRIHERLGDTESALRYLREHLVAQERLNKEQRQLDLDEIRAVRQVQRVRAERNEALLAHDQLEAKYARRTRELEETTRALERTVEEQQRVETERAALEAQLRHAQRLDVAGRMAAGVAHDFNNALMVIRSYADIALEQRELDPEAQEALSIIRSTSHSAGRLTYQLLAFARKQSLRLERLDVNEVIRDCEGMLAGLLGRSCEFELKLAAHPCPIFADRGQFLQVLTNLAANAGDAMGVQGHFQIRTARADGVVLLTLSDTGIGMEPAIQEQIFEPFFSTKGEKGYGLGLSTVHGIVHQLGGTIQTTSVFGQGTRFELEFPVCSDDHRLEAIDRRAPLVVSGKPRVLLVESDPALESLICVQLRKNDHFVKSVRSTPEAFRYLDQHQDGIDLVISDVMVRQQSGLELVRSLQRVKRDVGVILISGYPESRRQFVGPDRLLGFLQKPFQVRDLVELVESARVSVRRVD